MEVPARKAIEALMKFKETYGIVLMVVALALCALQGGIWMKSTAHAKSETDKQEREERHPPNEVAGIAGTILLVTSGVLLSLRPKDTVEESWRP